jgi:hypothetical protein
MRDKIPLLSVSCLPFRIRAIEKNSADIEDWPSLCTVHIKHDAEWLPLPTVFLPLGRRGLGVVGLAVAPSTTFEGIYIRVGLIEALSTNSSVWGKQGEYGELYASISNSANWKTTQLV